MGIIIVEQFNPVNGYWNKLYEVDENIFDAKAPFTINKYNGPYRTRLVGSSIIKETEVKKSVKKEQKKVPKRKSAYIANIWD